MKKLVIGLLFGSVAFLTNAANWEVIHINSENDVFSIDTTRVNKVKTRLSTTGEVISVWRKTDLAEKFYGASYLITEEYIKCKDFEKATNTFVSYNSNGDILTSVYNAAGPSVNFFRYEPILPDSVNEFLARKICKLKAY